MQYLHFAGQKQDDLGLFEKHFTPEYIKICNISASRLLCRAVYMFVYFEISSKRIINVSLYFITTIILWTAKICDISLMTNNEVTFTCSTYSSSGYQNDATTKPYNSMVLSFDMLHKSV